MDSYRETGGPSRQAEESSQNIQQPQEQATPAPRMVGPHRTGLTVARGRHRARMPRRQAPPVQAGVPVLVNQAGVLPAPLNPGVDPRCTQDDQDRIRATIRAMTRANGNHHTGSMMPELGARRLPDLYALPPANRAAVTQPVAPDIETGSQPRAGNDTTDPQTGIITVFLDVPASPRTPASIQNDQVQEKEEMSGKEKEPQNAETIKAQSAEKELKESNLRQLAGYGDLFHKRKCLPDGTQTLQR